MKSRDSETPANPQSTLDDAIADIERSVCADGSSHGGIPEGELSGYEWRALFRWAERTGHVVSNEIIPERVGGREHDVTFQASERRWMKFTKPDGCGLTVDISGSDLLLLPANPLQYLRRVRLQNEFWKDDTQLVGVQIKTPGARIVTYQPDVKGEPPDMEVLHDYLCSEFGFQRLNIPPMGYYKSLSYLRGNLGMFDVHPANFFQTAPGVIVPIDVIMIEFAGDELAALKGKVG